MTLDGMPWFGIKWRTLDFLSCFWSSDHPDYICNIRDIFVSIEDNISYRYVRNSRKNSVLFLFGSFVSLLSWCAPVDFLPGSCFHMIPPNLRISLLHRQLRLVVMGSPKFLHQTCYHSYLLYPQRHSMWQTTFFHVCSLSWIVPITFSYGVGLLFFQHLVQYHHRWTVVVPFSVQN